MHFSADYFSPQNLAFVNCSCLPEIVFTIVLYNSTMVPSLMFSHSYFLIVQGCGWTNNYSAFRLHYCELLTFFSMIKTVLVPTKGAISRRLEKCKLQASGYDSSPKHWSTFYYSRALRHISSTLARNASGQLLASHIFTYEWFKYKPWLALRSTD